MATIKEIAELAGVSRGTVDRVLNNRGSVSPQTARKVLDIAKALRYRPNRAGIVLAAQKRNLKIGVILFDNGNPFFDEVLQGVESKAQELADYNCSVSVTRVGFDPAAQLAAMDSLVQDGANGIILTPCNDPLIRDKINELSARGIPVITTNTDIENSDRLAYVGCDFYRSGETAAGLMHLIAVPPIRAGIITGSSRVLCHTDRIAGFRDRIRSHYPDIRILDMKENSDDEVESYANTLAMLKVHPDLNALYFAAGGVYGGCRAVLASGRTDITIISCDKVPTTREMLLNGVINATICQQPAVQGSLPLELLFTYLATGEKPAHEHNHTIIDIRIRENV
ncbi:MAG TPA: LacI family DNA-binding transcriptional regulator [Candidatus Eisenbergiella merdipullorum]|uniref:LacI family DNA-binding transcriptional regulator n=1 Tax=Candidatus Eisenbergiella merdipullorum TaxID=2838553 RepID=A0A9D2KYR6_9FIRM|nr:LacI family DNA-binding transcriptional regulator [Candidatus Eisenbergiella merdipullorum]